MPQKNTSIVSTGQAAKLCKVTPDTILKWIRKGRLRGSRTAGGHYRISLEDLQPHIPRSGRMEMPMCFPQKMRCWEYLSNKGVVRESCKRCVVYQVGAARCFLMASMETEIGHARRFCQNSCEECVYYRRMKGLATRVLVISSDDEFIRSLTDEEDESVELRVARSAYDASAIVQDFRPAFAVIDQGVATVQSGLLESMANDPRIPGLKVILVTGPGRKSPTPEADLVICVTQKPLSLRQIADVISRFPVDSVLTEDSSL